MYNVTHLSVFDCPLFFACIFHFLHTHLLFEKLPEHVLMSCATSDFLFTLMVTALNTGFSFFLFSFFLYSSILFLLVEGKASSSPLRDVLACRN